jgi:hypothetical protein
MKRIFSKMPYIQFAGILVLITVIPAYGQEGGDDGFQQFLFPSFSNSLVRTKAGKEVNIILNYNMVSEKMVFEQKGQYFDLINPEQVDTAYIGNRKFIPRGKEFLEVLVTGNFPFFIQHRAELQAPPRPGAYGTTSALTSSNYLAGYQTDIGYYNFKLPAGYIVNKSPFYWIRKGEEWIKINSEKQVPKVFPGSRDQIRDFIRENGIDASNRSDMIKLGIFCNRLPE